MKERTNERTPEFTPGADNRTTRQHKSGNPQKKNSQNSGKQKKRKKNRIFVVLILIVVVFLVLFLVGLLWYINQLDKLNSYSLSEDAIHFNEMDDSHMEDYTNFIVFGVDSRDNALDEDTRSDSMIVVSIHNKTHKIRLLSLYRDTYVDVEGHGFTKLTHAYAYGGPELAISTINKNFDLNIEDFVTVNFSTLTNVIDALGGIRINIKEEEIDYVNAYTRDVARINGTKAKKIKHAGRQKLNGTQATAYCRVRYTAGGDFTRAQRQRTVLHAIIKKMKKSNPFVLVKIMEEMFPQIYTSFSGSEITRLGIHAFSYEIEKDSGFPFDKTTPTIDGMSVVFPQTLSSNVTRMHKFLFQTKNYAPSETVEELNTRLLSTGY